MFTGFTDETVQFFLDLKFHNNTPYFHENHDRYVETVQTPFYEMITDLGDEMRKIDPLMEIRPYKCLSRINRDTRYSRDKSPYRDHHWVAFRQAARDKDGAPFYWFEIRLESVSWGLGVWGENPALLDALRRRMEADPQTVCRALRPALTGNYIQGGQIWKKIHVPGGLPVELASIYPARQLYFERTGIEPHWIFEADIADRVAVDFKQLAPVWQLLRGLNDIEGGES